ncbi:MAG: TolC family protein [Enterobacterales bacterium]|uniref:TolC family protein n=1 Tax=Serratia sp. (in: enterobacteria) TaxID=616 RepID=UPI003F3762D8
MKRYFRFNISAIALQRVIISLVVTTHCMKANSTEFIDIIRMTADHPAIQAAQSAAGAASFDIDVAKSASNIQFSAGVSSVGYAGQPGNESNLVSPHINISKVLYDHGRTDAMVDGKEAEYQMQRAQIMVTRENINQQALSLFTTAVSNAKVVEILDQEIETLKDLLQRVKTIASIDPGRASEINQVATRLSSVIASREASNTSQQQAWTQLSLLLHKSITLTYELPDLKKAGLLPADLNTAESVLMESPSFVAARYKRDAAAAAVQVASKWNRPKWGVQLTLNSPRTNGEMEPFKAATVQVSSDLNLWDGGAGSATLKGETQRLSSAEQEMEATSRNLKQQVEQLWISMPLREQQMNALLQQSNSALKTWQAGETQFFAGKRPLTDLISFATDYYSSLASYEEQRIQYLATQWQVVAALGKLSDLSNKVKSLPANKLLLSANYANTLKDNTVPAINNEGITNKTFAENSSIQFKNDVENWKQKVSQVSPPIIPAKKQEVLASSSRQVNNSLASHQGLPGLQWETVANGNEKPAGTKRVDASVSASFSQPKSDSRTESFTKEVSRDSVAVNTSGASVAKEPSGGLNDLRDFPWLTKADENKGAVDGKPQGSTTENSTSNEPSWMTFVRTHEFKE